MDKVLIKETGEEATIRSQYSTFTINVEIEGYDDITTNTDIKNGDVETFFNSLPKDKVKDLKFEIPENSNKEMFDNMIYVLENGEEYHKEELIIGLDNIRDYKLNKLNGSS